MTGAIYPSLAALTVLCACVFGLVSLRAKEGEDRPGGAEGWPLLAYALQAGRGLTIRGSFPSACSRGVGPGDGGGGPFGGGGGGDAPPGGVAVLGRPRAAVHPPTARRPRGEGEGPQIGDGADLQAGGEVPPPPSNGEDYTV